MVKKAFQLLKRTFTKPEGLELDSIGPVSRLFGEDRGTPIDRYYIEQFLSGQQQLITGTVLEIAESSYSKKFGQNVSKYEVLFINHDNRHATIIGDLTKPETLPSNTIDCFVCTQTFNFIYNFSDAIRGAFKVLKPGGYLLATVAGPSQISRYDMDRWGDYWRFTTLSATKMFEDVFGAANVEVESYGNCLTAVSLVRGIAAEEIPKAKLDLKDPDYEVIITITARKSQVV
jgi:SAM-dependent methyltransferase